MIKLEQHLSAESALSVLRECAACYWFLGDFSTLEQQALRCPQSKKFQSKFLHVDISM